MEDAKAAMAHQQQQQQHLMLQHQQQHQHQQQQFLLLQQIQQQHKQQQAISRFPSNIDAHLRPLQRPINNQLQQQQQQQQQQQMNNLNPNPNLLQNPNAMSLNSQIRPPNRVQNQGQSLNQTHPSPSPPPPANQAELQMAYQDAWRVCHPDFKRPFSSLEDACERLLPYHVVADYEAEEDDRILDSDTTGQVLSRCQQWDHSIANKVAEFTATFEKQVLAFNIISRKRSVGEFRSEERLLIEQALLQEERRALFEARAEIETRQKAGREAHAANLRMAAMAQAEQARAEMMARAPIRASALGSMGGEQNQEQEVNPDEMMNGWGSNNNNNNDNNNNNNNNNNQKDEKEPSEDFLNDEERENGDTGVQSDWREGGEFDLNTR